MTTRSRPVLLLHRLLLRLAGPPFTRVWSLAYRLIARAWVAYLLRGERDASAYVRGSVGSDDVLPGLSDVDVAVVLNPDAARPGAARERVTERWMRPRRAFRLTDLLLDYPFIFEEPELVATAGSSALTHGLDTGSAVYFGREVSQDRIRMLERPGTYSSTGDWRPLRGPDRRPPEGARTPQLRRIAAWLELEHWWEWALGACADPAGPRTASLCVKLVSDPARVWLWLAHGERAESRADVLRQALLRLPEEEEAIERALWLQRSLTTSPEPPLGEVLPALVRMSQRMARLLAAEVAEDGATEVELVGLDPVELVHGHGGARPGLLPLSDPKTLTQPRLPDESFGLDDAYPGDPVAIGAAVRADSAGPYTAFAAEDLIVLPARRHRARMRAVKCALTDPVTFAVAAGRPVASFPDVTGWSVADVAARSVAEHRAWLYGASGVDGSALGMLLGAARAALLWESVRDGRPQLALTLTAAGRSAAERWPESGETLQHALEAYGEFAVHRTPPPERILRSTRSLVEGLDPFRDGSSLAAIEQ